MHCCMRQQRKKRAWAEHFQAAALLAMMAHAARLGSMNHWPGCAPNPAKPRPCAQAKQTAALHLASTTRYQTHRSHPVQHINRHTQTSLYRGVAIRTCRQPLSISLHAQPKTCIPWLKLQCSNKQAIPALQIRLNSAAAPAVHCCIMSC